MFQKFQSYVTPMAWPRPSPVGEARSLWGPRPLGSARFHCRELSVRLLSSTGHVLHPRHLTQLLEPHYLLLSESATCPVVSMAAGPA